MRWTLPILGLKPIRRLMQKFAKGGPDAQKRNAARVYLWGEVANARGEKISMTMTTPEGYAFTAISAVTAAERILASPKAGAFTPSKLFGAEFVMKVPGVVIDA